jgi:hypothetical protein
VIEKNIQNFMSTSQTTCQEKGYDLPDCERMNVEIALRVRRPVAVKVGGAGEG